MFTKTFVIATLASIIASPMTVPTPAAPTPQNTSSLAVVQETTLTPILNPRTPNMSAVSKPRTFTVRTESSRRWTVATAYSSTPDQTDSTPFTTASGTTVRDGIVAANWLPIGARIRLPEIYGQKVFVVEDRMNPRFADRLDVWMTTREEAKNFGVQRVLVEVL